MKCTAPHTEFSSLAFIVYSIVYKVKRFGVHYVQKKSRLDQEENDLEPWNLHAISHFYPKVQHIWHIISQASLTLQRKKEIWYLVTKLLRQCCYHLWIIYKFPHFQILFEIWKQEIFRWFKIRNTIVLPVLWAIRARTLFYKMWTLFPQLPSLFSFPTPSIIARASILH